MPGVTLEAKVLAMLMDSGTWVKRRELDALTSSRLALDDVLADLVTGKRVEFDLGAGYRLAHSVVVRRAMRMLHRGGLNRAVAGRLGSGPLVLGVAQMTAVGVVGFEVALPEPDSVEGRMAQAAQVARFCHGNLLKGFSDE